MSSEPVLVRKADGTLEPFDELKLRSSLSRAGASEAACDAVTEKITRMLSDGISTALVYRKAFAELKKLERTPAARYSMKRAVLELGPSGFPFEKFVAEIFRTEGFEAATGVIVQGACAEHEVDLVAHRGNEHIGAEMKFHNKLGFKSDLKIALYVKARFDDIQKANPEGPNRLAGWLITNTKFTHHAISYSECAGLTLVSWNYPYGGTLQDRIERAGVQPITALTSLSKNDKLKLLQQDLVLCRSLWGNEAKLSAAGFPNTKIDGVLHEANTLCGPQPASSPLPYNQSRV
jgi:hypothetical protein